MNTRKDFIKKALGGIGIATLGTLGFSTEAKAEPFKPELLSTDEHVFLHQFKNWVTECSKMVSVEKKESRWLKDNPKIMEIAEQAQTWMPKAALYMENREFKKQFLVYSLTLTELIEDHSVSNFKNSR